MKSRNGYRARRWDARAGTIALEIPRLRSGSHFPDWLLAPRRRAEKALVAAIADADLAGVSTRRVDRPTLKERLNKEIRRRTDVVDTFPDRASVLRVVGAVLAETHHEWADARRYMTVDALLRPDPVTGPEELLLEQAA